MLAGAVLLGCTTATLAQGRPARASDVDATIASALERVHSAADLARETRLVAGLGTAALGPLFDRLGSAHEGSADMLRCAFVLGALGQLPREPLLAFLVALSRSTPDDERRQRGLELLGRVGARDELKLAIELGAPSDPAFPPGPELRAALETALLGICARERGALRTLVGFFPRALPAAQAAIGVAASDFLGQIAKLHAEAQANAARRLEHVRKVK